MNSIESEQQRRKICGWEEGGDENSNNNKIKHKICLKMTKKRNKKMNTTDKRKIHIR
jgi:hypothetical protein